MNSYDNIIVYLWLVPVTVLIVIPLLWSLITWLYRFIQRTRLVEVEGCILDNAGKSFVDHLHFLVPKMLLVFYSYPRNVPLKKISIVQLFFF